MNDFGPVDWQNPISAHPLNRGLVAWWLAGDENPFWGGPQFRDLFNKTHLSLRTGTTWRIDGLQSTAGDRGAAVATPTALQLAAPLTTAWYGNVLGTGSAYGTPFVVSYTNADTSPYLAYGFDRNAGGNEFRFMTNANGGSGGSWYGPFFTNYTGPLLLVGTVSGTTGTAYAFGTNPSFTNGQQGTFASASIAYATSQTCLGSLNYKAGNYANCVSESAWVWNRALSLSELNALFYQARFGHPDTLRRHAPARKWVSVAAPGGSSTSGNLLLLGAG